MTAGLRPLAFGAALAAVAVAAALAAPGVARATGKLPSFNSQTNAITVALGCRIRNVKEIVVTNTTQATIPAGTVIGYDAVRYGSTSHYGGSFTSPRMLPGTEVRFGGEQSASCTAWYRRAPVLSQ